MNNQEKLKKLIVDGSLEFTGHPWTDNCRGAELTKVNEDFNFDFYGEDFQSLAEYVAKAFDSEAVPDEFGWSVSTQSKRVEKWLTK